ncbi:MAG TPA: type I-C CRISPR-associated protein Cas7/Csd2 [Phycisphaerae bacterium]|nr:type I-C CRISPR-associated protein Cas7/Csd2 [Phycisphaerae bacterium]
MSTPVQNRYDFVYLFDVADGNPNGDPDAGNLPRVDAETGQGLVTDVCLKRKVRNYVSMLHNYAPPYDIYIRERSVLNEQHAKGYKALDLNPEAKKLPRDEAKARELTAWMCNNFFDIRAFGAVMTTEVNAGQVRGPIQLTMARSIDPIVPGEFAITRCAVTNTKDAANKDREMGRKFTIPYGLYKGFGYISPMLADPARHGTNFSEDDLALFKKSLNMMFENDHSAARGRMSPVRCIAFKHSDKLGNARADQLFSLIHVELKSEAKSEGRPARSKEDYVVTIDKTKLPDGVTVEEWVS